MRRSLAILLVLVLLCSCGVAYAAGELIDDSDEVRIEEIVRYGDPSVAEGISIDTAVTCRRHLFWNTSHTVGRAEEVETAFRFSADTEYDYDTSYYSAVNLRSGLEFNFDMEGSPVWEAYEALAATTPAGQSGEATVYISDYYDYYPVSVDVDTPSFVMTTYSGRYIMTAEEQAIYDAFNDFFRIPVLEDDRRTISLDKRIDGEVYSWGSSWTDCDTYSIYSQCVARDDAVYFTVTNRSQNGEIMDFSLVPGGYGIYKMPYTSSYSGTSDVEHSPFMYAHADELEMVYPLREEQCVEFFAESPDGNKLLLFTHAYGLMELTVIDAATMATLQVIEIMSGDEEDNMWTMYLEDDFIALHISDDRLALISMNPVGEYGLEFIVEMNPENETLYYLGRDNALDWNGEQLAVAGFASPEDPGYYYTCDYHLAVYDETGLLYFGVFDSSLSSAKESTGEYGAYDINSGMDSDPINVKWN